MKPWQLIVIALAFPAAAGCRTDPAIPILERQLRLQEDEIYRLRAKLEDFQEGGRVISDRAVDEPRSNDPESREPAPSRRRPNSRNGRNGNGSNGAGSVAPPVIELPSQPASGVPDALKTPAGAMEVPDVPEFLKQPSKPIPQDDRPSGLPPKPTPDKTRTPKAGDSEGPALQGNEGAAASRRSNVMMATRSIGGVPFTPSGDSRRVASIALNRTLSGGISGEDGAGDQGVLVVVEPRDRSGRTVDAPAEISIAVLDPALLDNEGKAVRVARWDFSAAETAAMFRSADGSRAIHLTTTWPGEPPTHNKLHLFVRYVTADGRKLETNQPIEVALPGDKTARWTPSESGVRSDRRAFNETPAARVPGPSPHTATRSNDAQSRRPTWSPERR